MQLNPICDYNSINTFIRKKALLKMLKHCKDFREARLEVMGFMVGHKFNGPQEEFTIIEDVVTSDLDTSSVSVKFASFEPLFAELDRMTKEGKDYILLGWYHSHPGHTSFMSPTDIDTQRQMFKNTHQSAIVIDPINIEMKAFTLINGDVYEKPYAILEGDDTLEDSSWDKLSRPSDETIIDADTLDGDSSLWDADQWTPGDIDEVSHPEWEGELHDHYQDDTHPADFGADYGIDHDTMEEGDDDIFFVPDTEDVHRDITRGNRNVRREIQPETSERPQANGEEKNKINALDFAWIISPLLFGILGGTFGYLYQKENNKAYSYILLLSGVVFSIIWYSGSYLFY